MWTSPLLSAEGFEVSPAGYVEAYSLSDWKQEPQKHKILLVNVFVKTTKGDEWQPYSSRDRGPKADLIFNIKTASIRALDTPYPTSPVPPQETIPLSWVLSRASLWHTEYRGRTSGSLHPSPLLQLWGSPDLGSPFCPWSHPQGLSIHHIVSAAVRSSWCAPYVTQTTQRCQIH